MGSPEWPTKNKKKIKKAIQMEIASTLITTDSSERQARGFGSVLKLGLGRIPMAQLTVIAPENRSYIKPQGKDRKKL